MALHVARRHRRLVIGLVAVALVTTSCGDRTASPTGLSGARVSGGPLRLGIDWGRSDPVERPVEFEIPSDQPASSGQGRSGHPLHFPGQAMLADVVATAHGFVCVGYVFPGWHPDAWTSPDGVTWSERRMEETEFTFPVSVAVGADGSVVAVGRSGSKPHAWRSTDGGRTWTSLQVPTLGDGRVAERMTTVIAVADGYLAGGSVGPELFDRRARFWHSTDGTTWEPVPDDATAFGNAEVRSIVTRDGGFLAIGFTGSVQDITGSVAWTSPDGRTWTRIDDPALAMGRAVAVVRAPFGGFVAVGSALDEGEAFAWTSADGRAWTLAPSESSRQYPGKVRMTDATVVGDQVIGVGNYVGLQRGTAVSWITTDGRHWEIARSAPVQEQGEMYAVVPGGPGIIAVGSFGAPDDYIPTVWLSPAR